MRTFTLGRVVAGLSVVAGLGAGTLVSLPAGEATPVVGALGPVKVVSTPGSSPGLVVIPTIAVLPSGATVVAWGNTVGTSLFARVRGANSGTWGPLRSYSVPATWQLSMGDQNESPMSVKPLGSNGFLLTWLESKSGTTHRVRAARMTTSSGITAKTLSGADTHVGFVRAAVNASGRALVTWTETVTGLSRFAVAATPTASWSAPASANGGAQSLYGVGAVASNGSLCLLFWELTSPYPAKAQCRTATSAPTGGQTWASGLGAPKSLGPAVAADPTGVLDITAVGNRFIAALLRSQAGVPPLVIGSSPGATSIRVYELPSAGSNTWTQKAMLSQAGQFLTTVRLSTASDGHVVLSFARAQGAVGMNNVPYGVARYFADRNLAGVWSGMYPVSSVTGNAFATFLYGTVFNHAVAGPAGEVAVVAMTPILTSPSFAAQGAIRTAATGPTPQVSPLGASTPVADVAIAPNGQVTFVVVRLTSPPTIAVRTTALAGGAS